MKKEVRQLSQEFGKADQPPLYEVSSMEMTDIQIYNKYDRSDDKKEIITILAELNGCSKDKIKNILREYGVVFKEDKNRKPQTLKKHIENKKQEKIKKEIVLTKKEIIEKELKDNGITNENFDLVVPEIIIDTLEKKLDYLLKQINKMTKEAEDIQVFLEKLKN